MEKGRTFESIVGVLVLIIAAFFFNYVYSRSGWKGVDGYVLTAKFDRADGLSEGGDVKISGIRVGKIISATVDPKTFFAVVKFYVSNEIQLPKDSSAGVSSDGLFGGKYLALVPGGAEEKLQANDEIEDTTGPVSIESLISKFVFSQQKDDAKK